MGGGVYAWMSTRPDPNAVSYVTQVVERGPDFGDGLGRRDL